MGNNNSIITNIVLIGMSGTFKTTAGHILAERLGMNFMDTDEYFEFEYSTKIGDCIGEYGEETFRDLEAKVIDRVYYFDNTVIATGGGVVERDDNMEKLKRHGIVILLTCELPVIYKRLRNCHERPLIKGLFRRRKLKRLAERRREKYLKYADIRVDNTHLTPEETADAVTARLLEFYKR